MNCGFENGLAPWSTSLTGAGTGTVDTTDDPHSGSANYRAVAGQDGTSTVTQSFGDLQPITYDVIFWARDNAPATNHSLLVAAGSSTSSSLIYADGSSNGSPPSNPVGLDGPQGSAATMEPVDSDWTRIAVTFTSNTANPEGQIGFDVVAGSYSIDDVQITPANGGGGTTTPPDTGGGTTTTTPPATGGSSTPVTTTPTGGSCTTAPFPDVPTSSPFCADITYLVSNKITTGYSDGNFHPAASVTRQAVAAFLYRYEHPTTTAPACATAPFSDVLTTSPFCPQIAALKAEGVIGGFPDGSFKPTGVVTRQALASFLYKISHPGTTAPACTTAPFPDVPVSSEFCGVIAALASAKVITGYSDGTFKPIADVSRQATAAFLHRQSQQ